jgi:PAS domain S-box-containing protein
LLWLFKASRKVKDDMAEKAETQFDMQAVLEEFPILKQVLQNIKQVVWLVDLKTDQILYVSPAFETIWGRSCDSLYADSIALIESVHQEDRVKWMSNRLDENHTTLSHNYRIRRPDGSLRWIFEHTFLLQKDLAEPIYQVCIAQDTTDQHEVDETLRKALDRSREQFTLSRRMSLARKPEAVLKTLMSAAELRSAQRAFVLFFDFPPAGPAHEFEVITAWSSASHLNGPNPSESVHEASLLEDLAMLDLFNPSKPVIVTDIEEDERVTPAVRDQLLERLIKSVAIFPLVALGSWIGCILIFFTKEKHFKPVAFRHIKVLVDQATITLYNLQLLENEAELRHEAERANEIKTKFLAMISHELRTPLTSIKGFTTTLLADDVVWEPEEQRDFVQTIQQETNRLQELIDHLLDLSRLEAGMLPILLESRFLQEVTADALPQLGVMTHKHNFSIHLPSNLPAVLVDAKRIAQVLVNLVHNATQYTPDGTEIMLTARVSGGFLQVSVADQGPGIPSKEHKRVFQAFQRGVSEDSRVGKGAGLGLAICKGLVEAHGGRIWIKKRTRRGTTISFTIPLASSHSPITAIDKV